MELQVYFSQQKYIVDILKECRMVDCKPSGFPMEQHNDLLSDTGTMYANPLIYRILVGQLIDLTIT